MGSREATVTDHLAGNVVLGTMEDLSAEREALLGGVIHTREVVTNMSAR
jgi:hypothetical protein